LKLFIGAATRGKGAAKKMIKKSRCYCNSGSLYEQEGTATMKTP